ncbi:uncharacterized protein [Palaemon carinicauda]|uniref:uncharacterized protein n=1 Tax=Palaemon carinicauda TaxID=392227 RepID=UPI0035B60A67
MASRYPFSKETYNGFLLRAILDEVGPKFLREIYQLACKKEGINKPLTDYVREEDEPDKSSTFKSTNKMGDIKNTSSDYAFDINDWISKLKELSLEKCPSPDIDSETGSLLASIRSKQSILKRDKFLYPTKSEEIKNLIQKLKDIMDEKFCCVEEELQKLNKSMEQWLKSPLGFNKDKFKELFDSCEMVRCKVFKGWETEGTLERCMQKLKDIRNDDVYHKWFFFLDDEKEVIISDITYYIQKAWNLAKTRFSLGEEVVQDRINILNEDIDRLRSEPLNVTEDEFHNLVTNFGKLESLEVLKSLIYVSMSSGRRVGVSQIFVLPEIAHLPGEKIIKLENLYNKKEVALIEGISGMGKLTLLKFLVCDWISGNCCGNYDLVIPISFQGRSENLSDSLSGIIRSYMPNTFEKFMGEKEMFDWILKLKVLIFFNGLNLRNTRCKKLFEDILNVNKAKNFTIICTARPGNIPENLKKIFTKRFELRGLPEQSLEDFFKKYQSAMHGIVDERSLSYFKKMWPFLSDQFKLPLNLMHFSSNLPVDTTSTTIYETLHNFHEMMKERLITRLVQDLSVPQISKASLREKISKLMLPLKEDAFEGLKAENLRLSDTAMKKLEELCKELELPTEEVLSAFLAPKPHLEVNSDVQKWQFTNKEQQRLFAGLHVYDLITGERESENVRFIQSDMVKCFVKYQVPFHRFSDILNVTMETLTKTYSQLVSTVLKGLMDSNMQEYKNILVILIGIFHKAGDKVDEKIVSETVHLLMKSGNLGKNIWAKIFNNIYFDKNTLKMIYQNPDIAKGIGKCNLSKVSFDTILAYGNWFRENSIREIGGINPSKNLFQTPGFKELLIILIRHQYHSDQLLRYLYLHPSFPLSNASFQEHIRQRLADRNLRTYKGPLLPEVQIPTGIRSLSVSLGCSESFAPLRSFLESPHDLKTLEICVNVGKVDPSYLNSLISPSVSLFMLYLPDVTNSTVTKAIELTRILEPLDKPLRVYFPRCRLDKKDFGILIRGLEKKKSKRHREVYFPSCYEGTESESRRKSLENRHNVLFHFTDFQMWGENEDGETNS